MLVEENDLIPDTMEPRNCAGELSADVRTEPPKCAEPLIAWQQLGDDERVEMRDPRSLKNHHLNIQLYGDVADEAFVDDIREHGVVTPILVAADGATIISGHRRCQAARKAGLALVPVIRTKLEQDHEVRQTLISANVQRQKTNEQISREFKELERLMKELPSGQAPSGRIADAAARELGVDRWTAQRGASAVQMADTLRAEGRTADADQIIATLNGPGAAPALKQARKLAAAPSPPAAKPELSDQDRRRQARVVLAKTLDLVKPLAKAMEEARQLCRVPTIESEAADRKLEELNAAIIDWKDIV